MALNVLSYADEPLKMFIRINRNAKPFTTDCPAKFTTLGHHNNSDLWVSPHVKFLLLSYVIRKKSLRTLARVIMYTL